jgi:hypothetical protein
MKKKLAKEDNKIDISTEYLQIVNLGRVIFVYVIQLLYDANVKLNGDKIQKFLVVDSELDLKETPEMSKKLLKYDFIRQKIDTKERISKIYFLIL